VRPVNLLPRQQDLAGSAQNESRAMRQILVAAAVSLLVVFVIVAAAFEREQRAASRRQAVLTSLDQQLAAIQSTAAATAAARTSAQARYDAVVGVAAARVPWDRFLDGVSRVIPSGAWLSQVAAQPSVADTSNPTSPATGAAPSPAVTIQGYARSQDIVADLLRRLSYVPALADVSLQQTQKVDVGTSKAIQFTIAASVRWVGGSGS
jgi:Tfp pilus assembly protein PilN